MFTFYICIMQASSSPKGDDWDVWWSADTDSAEENFVPDVQEVDGNTSRDRYTEESADKLLAGWECTVLSTTRKPARRNVVLFPALQMLFLKKGNKVKGSVRLDTVVDITRGKHSPALQKAKNVADAHCLTIHHGTSTLNLQLDNETERNKMYSGLCGLLHIELSNDKNLLESNQPLQASPGQEIAVVQQISHVLDANDATDLDIYAIDHSALEAKIDDDDFCLFSSTDLSRCVSRLYSGWECFVLSSRNKPKRRNIVIYPALQMLFLKKGNKVKGSVRLDSVLDITNGKHSPVLHKAKSVNEGHCLTIHHGTETLDLQLDSELERNEMHAGLCEVLNMEMIHMNDPSAVSVPVRPSQSSQAGEDSSAESLGLLSYVKHKLEPVISFRKGMTDVSGNERKAAGEVRRSLTLWEAAMRGDSGRVAALLDGGLDVNSQDYDAVMSLSPSCCYYIVCSRIIVLYVNAVYHSLVHRRTYRIASGLPSIMRAGRGGWPLQPFSWTEGLILMRDQM
jgi:hypothetical protein